MSVYYLYTVNTCKIDSILIDNIETFRGAQRFQHSTLQKNVIHRSIANLTAHQKGVSCDGIKPFSNLLVKLKCLLTGSKQVKTALKEFLLNQTIYSVEDLLLLRNDNLTVIICFQILFMYLFLYVCFIHMEVTLCDTVVVTNTFLVQWN